MLQDTHGDKLHSTPAELLLASATHRQHLASALGKGLLSACIRCCSACHHHQRGDGQGWPGAVRGGQRGRQPPVGLLMEKRGTLFPARSLRPCREEQRGLEIACFPLQRWSDLHHSQPSGHQAVSQPGFGSICSVSWTALSWGSPGTEGERQSPRHDSHPQIPKVSSSQNPRSSAAACCAHTHRDGILMKRRPHSSSHQRQIRTGGSEGAIVAGATTAAIARPQTPNSSRGFSSTNMRSLSVFKRKGTLFMRQASPCKNSFFFFFLIICVSQRLCKEMQADTTSKYEQSAASIPPEQKCFVPLMKSGVGC